jgi:thioredoxin reductase
MNTDFDVVIVGGGPAGSSAALTLGRAQRRVLLVDGGTPRNARAHEVHTFLTRDGTPPAELRRLSRLELAKYPNVTVRDGWVTKIEPGFSVVLGEERVSAKNILLTVGLVDEPPADIEGLAHHWGHSVFACPYCHGHELRGGSWGVFLPNDTLVEWALLLRGWTSKVVAFTHGATLSAEVLARLKAANMQVESEPIVALLGDRLTGVKLRSGKELSIEALFMRPPQKPTALVQSLGLALDETGVVKVDPRRESSVRGVFVAGDATTMVQGAILAAADGMMAGAMINHGLVVGH